ncbi:pre-mRNA 3'-end-processing factor FIP1 [Cottoperca gobio]|uniref:Pre-mRNA 3'-end-processing factor FIP1 n=1 Tax=Cottoperca gobio TaxID=56716 RepID=A0A6J2PIM9_COTGO|nr:pre-mRNA 3'-end-processing factor FIP1 [Cottoperca gobio]
MSSSESDASDSSVSEDDDGKLYQLIFDLIATDDKEEKEEVQIPSSSGHTLVHLEFAAEGRVLPHAVANNDTKGLGMDALDNIQEIPKLKGKAEFSEEKPWRSAGAHVSDYFNYGFDEESWNTYCKKHVEVGAAARKLSAKSQAEVKFHRRLPSDTKDVIRERPGSSRRVKGRNSQMAPETSTKADRFTSYPYNFTSLFAYISPPPYLYRSGPPPRSSFATLYSRYSKCFDDPSTSRHPCSSGVSSLIPRKMAYNAGVIDSAKSWQRYMRQEEYDKDRDRSREHGHDKGSSRGRDRERERCSSSHSGEERMRHRDNAERRHKRHISDSFSEKLQERSHSEGLKKSSRSSSSSSSSSSSRRRKSRRDGGEDRDSQSRDKSKKDKK